MCKYCECGDPLLDYNNYTDDARVIMEIFAGEISLTVDVDNIHYGRIWVEGIEIERYIPIEFCPICGRKLRL